MKDRIIIALLTGVLIGIIIMGVPIVKSGGGSIPKLENYKREFEKHTHIGMYGKVKQ